MTNFDRTPWSDIDIQRALAVELAMFPAAIAFFASALYGRFNRGWLDLWLNLSPEQAVMVGSGFLLVGFGFNLYRRNATRRWYQSQAQMAHDLKGVEIVFVGDHALLQKALTRFAASCGAGFSTLDHPAHPTSTSDKRVVVWYPGKAQDANLLRSALAELGVPVVLLASRDQARLCNALGEAVPNLEILRYPFVMGTLLDAVRRLAARPAVSAQAPAVPV